MTDYTKMAKAYKASKAIFDTRMNKERKEDLNVLGSIPDNEILIVPGQYDRIEQVFDLFGIRYGIFDLRQLAAGNLSPSKTLIINCPGEHVTRKALAKVKDFVEAGGFLFTTDWTLSTVLEHIFPDNVRYDGRRTLDEVVGVEVVDVTHPYLQGLFAPGADPQWWLETASYPITIVNSDRVKVLVRSNELGEKYGESPVIITFSPGKGTVLHMISHYYLQRSELRTNRHKESAAEYAYEMNVAPPAEAAVDLDDVSLGEVESAYTNAQFIANVMIERKKEIAQWQQSEEASPKNPVKKKDRKKAPIK